MAQAVVAHAVARREMEVGVGDRVQSAVDGLVPAGTEGVVEAVGPDTAVTVRLDDGSVGVTDISRLRCRRCLQPGSGQCQVLHPAACRDDMGASFGPGFAERRSTAGPAFRATPR